MKLVQWSLLSSLAISAFAHALNRDQTFETIDSSEAAIIDAIAKGAAAGVQALYDEAVKNGVPAPLALRDAHSKAHGCVNATFTVNAGLKPSDLDGYNGALLQVAGLPLSAIVRYSNGAGKVQADGTPDGRGMAIKLPNVSLPVYLGDIVDGVPTTSQDFMMINFPQFFIRNVNDYALFSRDRGAFMATHGTEAAIAGAIASSQALIKNPLGMEYFSMVPSLLGGRPMKFKVEPCPGQDAGPDVTTDNFFRENLKTHLATKAACFDFKFQLVANGTVAEKTALVEDPTVPWTGAFVNVARIDIPAGPLLDDKTCEGLSFNPWHATEELQPVGGIQRAREHILEAVFQKRRALNAGP